MGFQIVSVYENRPEALRYGVHPGDVVLSVNGQQLLTPAHLLQVFRLLRNATSLEIDLSRRGKKVEVRVPILDAVPAESAKKPLMGAIRWLGPKTCSRSSNMPTLRHSPAFVARSTSFPESRPAPLSPCR